MAGYGPPPKDPSERRRRNEDNVPRKEIPATPPDSYPPLPNADRYSEATQTWYQTWANAPQANRFLSTDWQRLHMLAPLVELYYFEPDKSIMAEIRLNEAALGATEADRLRLRWDIEVPKPDMASKPMAAAQMKQRQNRRANVLRLVDEA
jgi:hypothetical protein